MADQAVTVCIPTMNRFNYLVQSIPKYLQMACVERVIVCDETGSDAHQILHSCEWATNPKLTLHINAKRLGAYFNKLECIKLAHARPGQEKEKGCWVALIDSDNFAPEDTYFQPWLAYIRSDGANPNVVYAPASNISPETRNTTDFSSFGALDSSNVRSALYRFRQSFTLLNTGNYIVHTTTYLRHRSNGALSELIERRRFTASDVAARALALFNTGAVLQVVRSMSYEHSVHADSLFAVHGATADGRRDMNTIFNIAANMQAARMTKEGSCYAMTPLPPKSDELRPRK